MVIRLVTIAQRLLVLYGPFFEGYIKNHNHKVLNGTRIVNPFIRSYKEPLKKCLYSTKKRVRYGYNSFGGYKTPFIVNK